jgi:hypothetical protein
MLTDRIHRMPVLPPPATRRVDVEDILGTAGFTAFHRKAVAITGVAWTFVAMEILLVGFTLPLFGSIWNLSATWLGWIGARPWPGHWPAACCLAGSPISSGASGSSRPRSSGTASSPG